MGSGNHYAIQVKRNQPTLWNGLQDVLQRKLPVDEFTVSERVKGKPVTWLTGIYDLSGEPLVKGWANAKRLICVGKALGNDMGSLRLFISDLPMTDAKGYYQGIRGHWAIENQLHWVKDVFHKEDENGIAHPNGSINSSVASSMALNIHRKNGRRKIKKAQMYGNANFKKMIKEIRT